MNQTLNNNEHDTHVLIYYSGCLIIADSVVNTKWEFMHMSGESIKVFECVEHLPI